MPDKPAIPGWHRLKLGRSLHYITRVRNHGWGVALCERGSGWLADPKPTTRRCRACERRLGRREGGKP